MDRRAAATMKSAQSSSLNSSKRVSKPSTIFIHSSISLTVHPITIFPSIHPFIHPSIHPSIHPITDQFIHPTIYPLALMSQVQLIFGGYCFGKFSDVIVFFVSFSSITFPHSAKGEEQTAYVSIGSKFTNSVYGISYIDL